MGDHRADTWRQARESPVLGRSADQPPLRQQPSVEYPLPGQPPLEEEPGEGKPYGDDSANQGSRLCHRPGRGTLLNRRQSRARAASRW
jgi:hypothetical protein